MKSATGLTGSGSRDWFIQRVSAVVLAVYTVVILGWILLHGGFNYEQWSGFMMTLPMKILSLLAILSLAAHAWIGMWQVFTDYVTTRQMGPSASGTYISCDYCSVCICDLGNPDFLGELIGRHHGRDYP